MLQDTLESVDLLPQHLLAVAAPWPTCAMHTSGPPQPSEHAARNTAEAWLARVLYRPIDVAALVYFRIVLGTVLLWHVGSYFIQGGIDRYFIQPRFHFTYIGFEWVKPWPGAGMYLHFLVMGVAAGCVLVGICYRVSASLLFLAFTYTFLLDKALYQNHYYLICLICFFMPWLPAGRAVSLDTLNNPAIRVTHVPAWTLGVLRFHVGITYFFGGVAKLNHDWLHGEPMRMGLWLRSHYPLVGPYFSQEWMVWFFVYGGILFDLLVVPALLWRVTRIPAYVAALAFHLINAYMFDIGVFPWFMILATALFFEPSWPRRLVGAPVPSAPPFVPPQALSPVRRLALGVMAVYVTAQLLLPLRQHLYPGDTSWTEYGHRYSWRMMLRAKDSAVRFRITDPRTGQSWTPDLRPFLTRWQLERLGREPDMLIEFSHFLARWGKQEGHGDVEVRALVLTSLNGRKPQLFIDPTVDLAREKRTWWGTYPWVLPLVEPLRDAPWDIPLTEWEQHVQLDPEAIRRAARKQRPSQ